VTPTAEPTAPTAPKGTDRYWIQVAAMKDPNGAKRLLADLSAHDFPVDSSDPQARGLYLVRVGAFEDRASAVDALKRLKDLGYSDIFISRAR
jgi:cell division septation protein DedD